jgi:hypothetical protein
VLLDNVAVKAGRWQSSVGDAQRDRHATLRCHHQVLPRLRPACFRLGAANGWRGMRRKLRRDAPLIQTVGKCHQSWQPCQRLNLTKADSLNMLIKM